MAICFHKFTSKFLPRFDYGTLALVAVFLWTLQGPWVYAADISPTYQLGIGFGSESIRNQALSSRKQSNWILEGLLGLKYRRIGLGLFVDYRTHLQSTDPLEVGGTDASGKSLLYGPAVRFRLSDKIFVLAAYFLRGTYSLAAVTSAGQEVSYDSPSGYRGILSFRLNKKLFLDLGYTGLQYNQTSIGGVGTSIASDPIKSSAFELGFSFSN